MSLWPPPPPSLHPHCSGHPQCCSAQHSPSPPHSTLGSQAIFLGGSLVTAGNIFPHPSTFCSKQSFTQCCPQPWNSIRISWPLRGPGQIWARRMRKYSGLEGADSLAWLPAPAWKFFLEPEGSWELAQRPVPVKDISGLAWEWGSCETSLYLTGLLRGQVTSWIRKCLIKQHVNMRTCYNIVFMGKYNLSSKQPLSDEFLECNCSGHLLFWVCGMAFPLLLITIPPTPFPLRKSTSSTLSLWYCWGCHCLILLPGHRDGHVTQAWPITAVAPLHSYSDWSVGFITLKVWPITVLPGHCDTLKHAEKPFPSAGGCLAGVTWAIVSLVLPLSCLPLPLRESLPQ